MKLLMAGSRGQAKDLIGAFRYETYLDEVTLFDDVGDEDRKMLFDDFSILHTKQEAQQYFKNVSPYFIVAIASPQKRKEVFEKLTALGGRPFTYIASNSTVSEFSEISEKGVLVQMDCEIGQEVLLEEGVLINIQSSIGDGVRIGPFTTIAPDVVVMPGASIGTNCIISTGVTIAAGVTIGNNVKVWMGRTVDRDLPNNTNFI